jgi:hypothetical protein
MFLLVESAVLSIVHSDQLSRFTKIVAQVGRPGAFEMGFFGGEISRLMFGPLETGKTGDLFMTIVKTSQVANFGDDTSGEDRANAGDGSQRIGICCPSAQRSPYSAGSAVAAKRSGGAG